MPVTDHKNNQLTIGKGLKIDDERALGWNRAFERKSTVDPLTGIPTLGGTDGWRMADGGQVVALPGNRVLWLWGDTFTTVPTGGWNKDANQADFHLHGILGSTVALSGLDPKQAIHFFARYPLGGTVVDISTGDGVRQLMQAEPPRGQSGPFFRGGGWIYTGHEDDLVPANMSWRWLLNGIDIDGTLYLLYQTVGCADPNVAPGQACGFAFTGLTLIYRIRNTEKPITQWSFDPDPIPMYNKFGQAADVKWMALYDDRARTSFIYAFGIGPGDVNVGNLYVARVSGAKFADYKAWEFLHEGSAENWIAGDDRVWGDDTTMPMRILAKDVAQEFSVHRLTINGVPRWLLTHSCWGACEPPDPTCGWVNPCTYTDQECRRAGAIGILRVSKSDSFLDFPDQEDAFWFDAHDNEPGFDDYMVKARKASCDAQRKAQVAEDDLTAPWFVFRGLSAYPLLSFSASSDQHFLPREPREGPFLLVGYTVFADGAFHVDCFPKGCAPYGNNFCADHGGPCGARRFAAIDLAKIWPAESLNFERLFPFPGQDAYLPVPWPPAKPPPPPEEFVNRQGLEHFASIDRPMLRADLVEYARGSLDRPVDVGGFATLAGRASATVNQLEFNVGGVDMAAHIELAAFGDLTHEEQQQLQELSRLSAAELHALVGDITSGRFTYELSANDRAHLASVTPSDWVDLVRSIQALGSGG